MPNFRILFILGLLTLLACEKEKPQDNAVPLKEPTGLYLERLTESIVRVNWRDSSSDEIGYGVYLLKEGNSEAIKLAQTEPDETSYIINSSLEKDTIYYIGVRAESKNESESSEIVYSKMKMIPFSQLPTASVSEKASTTACLSLTYSLRNTESLNNIQYGLCWSEAGKASISDNILYGPSSDKDLKILQTISNLYLDYDKSYNVRVFITSDEGTYYVDADQMSLLAEPQEIKLSWTKLSTPDIPSEIEVYESKDKVNGKGFHGYYALVQLKDSKIDLGTNVPNALATIDAQMASFRGDCYVMVNGGYFASKEHTGIAINNFRTTGSINNQRGSISTADPYNTVLYPTTRGIFGVDDLGQPSVYWANGSGYGIDYFSYPVPSVKAEAQYPSAPSKWASAQMVDWLPRAAISAAPVLLKDGKCPFDFTTTARGDGFYYSNFEFVAPDIFGANSVCDRTAIGAMEDGRIVLFICDGRMSEYDGLDLCELAMVMKGIGCCDALNLDGGGSTGMMVGDKHYGDITVGGNRAVKSTVGFFRRR